MAKSKGGSAGGHPFQGRAIQLLVIVHCFMVRGIYNS